MSTFTTSISLHDADENDYAKLQGEIETQAKKRNQHVVINTNFFNGETKYKWDGDVSMQNIADTIFKAAPKTGKKYSFSIMRNK